MKHVFRKLGMISFSGSALLVGLMAGGCTGEAEEPTEGNDEGADSANELVPPESAPVEQSLTDKTMNLGPTYTETALSAHGGSGGGFTGHVTPPSIIYAVAVRSGAYVDNITFAWYQPRRFDNLYQNGDAYGNTPGYGGGGGGGGGWWYCPNGKGVIGVRGNSGALVDRIGVICGDVTNPNPNDPNNVYSPLWGGGGGGWFGEDKCPPGRLVDSFNTRSGSYLDNLQGICINAH
jgi:hypothetical protein